MNKNNSRVQDSAVSYELVVYDDDGVYAQADGKSFKGLLISGAGDLHIYGCNGEEITFPVTPGLYPFAGNSIVEEGTTATIAVVLF
jgi:hypothetical protein